ncbi:Xaa-Pro peptidase family protein [uncultured Parolsenella sp.]|uniref:Xaa-Pro peptidase family protein n=1 Tax=uncultured Parolsenella sp. TaxID=2083008 RepID=UPI0027DAEDB0|nr:Xaa-Pro peptidase family protein [uncultured Parolsenella sp.]
MNAHVENIRAFLADNGLDAFLVKSKVMKRYLGTLTGSGCKVLITPNAGYLICDGRYLVEAQEREHDLTLRVHAQGTSFLEPLAEVLGELGCATLAVEASEVLVPEWQRLQGLGVELRLLGDETAQMRIRKDDAEIAAVQRAVDAADDIYARVVDELHVGMTEYEVSALLQYYAIAAGADGMSFDTIVATGPRSAMPHGRPTERKICAHEPILIDFGVQLAGYQSDMTRVCFLGEPTDELRRAYEAVLAANLAGIDAIRVGALARDVDAAARAVITQAGYGEYFTHGLGHGIGMGGDLPLLNQSGQIVLDNRMIMSCEPGVYLPGVGGVRIEDDVLLMDGVARPLNATSKVLRVLEVR